MHDSQTPLVLLFKNESDAIQWMPPEWNVEGLGWKRVDREKICTARYLHWSGKFKPWSHDASHGFHHELWKKHAALVNKCAL